MRDAMSSTARVRQHRVRKDQGRACLRIEVELESLRDLLEVHGFLQQWDDHDRRKIACALEEALQVWGRYE
jgi:hypothetical protein